MVALGAANGWHGAHPLALIAVRSVAGPTMRRKRGKVARMRMGGAL